ncbi:MAG: hypothetical protein AVDCRST_MAG80-1494, partial [uncultured Rubrobacteraceae bacterium]
ECASSKLLREALPKQRHFVLREVRPDFTSRFTERSLSLKAIVVAAIAREVMVGDRTLKLLIRYSPEIRSII